MKFPISVIIPIYNEEKRIRRCLERTIEYFNDKDWDVEIIIVEDGCTDKSVNIVNEFSKKDSRINLLSLPIRLGKGGSVLAAVEHCNKSNIGFMDVDLSADPSQFEKLIPFLEKNDIVIGSRVCRDTLEKIARPIDRKILSYTYHLFFRCLFAINIEDLQCGFKLFKRNSLTSTLSEIKIGGFAFDTEFIVMSKFNGLNIKEVPITWSHDKDSKIKLSKTAINMGRDLLIIWATVFKAQIQPNNSFRGKIVARPLFLFRALASTPLVKTPIKQNVLTR